MQISDILKNYGLWSISGDHLFDIIKNNSKTEELGIMVSKRHHMDFVKKIPEKNEKLQEIVEQLRYDVCDMEDEYCENKQKIKDYKNIPCYMLSMEDKEDKDYYESQDSVLLDKFVEGKKFLKFNHELIIKYRNLQFYHIMLAQGKKVYDFIIKNGIENTNIEYDVDKYNRRIYYNNSYMLYVLYHYCKINNIKTNMFVHKPYINDYNVYKKYISYYKKDVEHKCFRKIELSYKKYDEIARLLTDATQPPDLYERYIKIAIKPDGEKNKIKGYLYNDKLLFKMV